MANQPKTPLQTFRAPQPLWKAAQEKARSEGTVLSVVLRGFLQRFVAGTTGDHSRDRLAAAITTYAAALEAGAETTDDRRKIASDLRQLVTDFD